MDVAVVGAGGVIGRQVAIALVAEGLLGPEDRLQLVGRRDGASGSLLHGLAHDLRDAWAEAAPELDLAFAPEEVLADVVVLCAGATITGRPGEARSRAALAAANLPVAEAVARAVAANGHGGELLLVVTNPVEPLVAACCRHLDRRRVLGMGAFLDTMRFRHEVAAELGVRRQLVSGLVLGEHGFGMVPCWSTVAVHGFVGDDGRARLAGLRRGGGAAGELLPRIEAALAAEGAAAAYRLIEGLDAGLRTMLRPWVTQLCGARTPCGTAETILRLLRTVLGGGQVVAAAQVLLAGEFLGLHGVTGAPVVFSAAGVDRIVPVALDADEEARVRAGVFLP